MPGSEPSGLCQRDGHAEDVREAGDEGGLDGLHQPQLPLLPPGRRRGRRELRGARQGHRQLQRSRIRQPGYGNYRVTNQIWKEVGLLRFVM